MNIKRYNIHYGWIDLGNYRVYEVVGFEGDVLMKELEERKAKLLELQVFDLWEKEPKIFTRTITLMFDMDGDYGKLLEAVYDQVDKDYNRLMSPK